MKRLLTLCIALAGMIGLISAQSSKMRVEVTFYTPSIVRIYKAPTQNTELKQSLSVIMKPEQVKVSRSQEKLSDNLVIEVYKSDQLSVHVYDNSVTIDSLANSAGCKVSRPGIIVMARRAPLIISPKNIT